MNTETKFTKGPWVFENDLDEEKYIGTIVSENEEDGWFVCSVHADCGHGKDNSESAANAKLIAMAPSLYEAIENAISFCENKDKGVKGTTYGDTPYDSLSVAYGYNLALDCISALLKPMITKVNK